VNELLNDFSNAFFGLKFHQKATSPTSVWRELVTPPYIYDDGVEMIGHYLILPKFDVGKFILYFLPPFNTISPFTILPNRHSRCWVQIVMKYAPACE
jgi:hypothetical protein